MKIAMRIECPHCKWGYPWRDSFINQGWLAHRCPKCGEKFYNKVTITGFSVNTQIELPEGVPCQTLPEAKEPDYCECSYPGCDSVSAKNNTCATCGKLVRLYGDEHDRPDRTEIEPDNQDSFYGDTTGGS